MTAASLTVVALAETIRGRYRTMLSGACRAILALADDVNTPLRAYRADVLESMLSHTPTQSIVPHLHFSRAEAELGLTPARVDVRSRCRRGSDESGVTWGRSGRTMPPWKLVRFSVAALREVLRRKVTPCPTPSAEPAPLALNGAAIDTVAAAATVVMATSAAAASPSAR